MATKSKTVVKSKAVKKSSTRKMAKSGNVEAKPMSKTDLYKLLAEKTGVDKKVVVAVMDELAGVVYSELQKGAVGKFTLPGVCKFVTKATPAKPEREGINRFTGEKATFKAKPASVKVKVVPVKTLKDAVVPSV